MRRSAAPSFRADIKKARFLQHIIPNISQSEKENNISCQLISKKPSDDHPLPTSSNVPSDFLSIVTKEESTSENFRSNEDILDLIFEADSTTSENVENVPKNLESSECMIKTDKSLTGVKPLRSKIAKNSMQINIVEDCKSVLSNCIYCIKNMEEATLFNVVYCKRSGKKHKTWEGDGLLIVKSRSAVLKDFNGKTIEKGLGYKLKETESLEEGSKFFIGGKECEIQFKVPEEEYQSGKYCKCDSKYESPLKEEKPSAQMKRPC